MSDGIRRAMQLVSASGKPIGTVDDEVWLKEPGDITVVLDAIMQFDYKKIPTLDELEKMSASLRDALVSGRIRVSSINWASFFLTAGAMTIGIIGKSSFDQQAFAEMLLGKHKRYGTRSLMGWKQIGILSRIDQKIARARTMTNNPQLIQDDQGESMKDTMIDIVGYCIVGLYMVERLKLG